MIHIPHHWSHDEIVRNLLCEILVNQEKQMAAIDTANANLTKLQADVATLIASKGTGGATEAQVQTLADGIAAVDATVVAATTA